MALLASCLRASSLTAIVLFASACASTVVPGDGASPDVTFTPVGNFVVLHETGGLLGIDNTTTLDASGAVTVSNGRTHMTTVTHAAGGSTAAQTLSMRIGSTGVFAIAPGDFTHGVVGGDLTQADLTLTRGGETFHYVVYEDVPATPPAVNETINDILAYVSSAH